MDHAIYFNTAFTDHIQKSHFLEDASTIYLKSQGSNTALEGCVMSFGTLLLKNRENLVVLVKFVSCKISTTSER